MKIVKWHTMNYFNLRSKDSSYIEVVDSIRNTLEMVSEADPGKRTKSKTISSKLRIILR